VLQAVSVAREFVRLSFSGDEADPLTNLRLQKLLYYAQAWSLVIRESELFSDDLEAWRCGPVVPAVYRALRDTQEANQINRDTFADAPDLEGEEAEFVGCVWDAYKEDSAIRLSDMTYQETPWLRAWGDQPKNGTANVPISVEDLEEFFARQTMPAPLAAYAHRLRKMEEEARQALAELPPLDADRLEAASKSSTPSARLHRVGGG
jgi:uncharacterized phage-associated protein